MKIITNNKVVNKYYVNKHMQPKQRSADWKCCDCKLSTLDCKCKLRDKFGVWSNETWREAEEQMTFKQTYKV